MKLLIDVNAGERYCSGLCEFNKRSPRQITRECVLFDEELVLIKEGRKRLSIRCNECFKAEFNVERIVHTKL